MIKILILFFSFSSILYSQNLNTSNIEITTSAIEPISIAYPYENLRIPKVDKTFIFGKVYPSTATFFINNSKIDLYKNGTFIAYLPVSSGSFKFDCMLIDGISTFTYTRNVYIGSEEIKKDTSSLNIEILSPIKDMEVLPNDFIFLAVKAGKSLKLKYKIFGKENELFENPKNSGFYYANYQVEPKDKGKKENIIFYYNNGLFSKKYKTKSQGEIKVLNSLYTIKTSTDNVILRNNISGGYQMFLPEDIKLIVSGKVGDNYKIFLGDQILWLDSSKASFLYPFVENLNTETGTITFKKEEGENISAKISIYDKLPYIIYEEDKALILEIYYAKLRTNWVIYDSSDTYTENVTFRQVSNEKLVYKFNFKKKLWGYSVNYDNNSLNLRFKFKPKISKNIKEPLKDLRIVLDSGHSPKRIPPYDGAIGPSSYFEYEANLKIAKKLEKKLLSLGATVYMTRTADETVPLSLRPELAKNFNGDLFISIHNNAIRDGEDPFSKERGFQIYYYHLHSKDFAEKVHLAFLKNIKLPDEGLRYGDYYVIRQTYMPSILIENAYMIIPEQEAMLMDESFIDKLAETTKEGILKFIGE